MPRRSSRLMSGGYYNSDEESDSSSVTNISYRENPVKVFKKKGGNRKSRTPTIPKSKASPASDDLVPSDLSPCTSASSKTQTETTMRTVSYVSYVATPRPALTPSSSRSQTPTLCSSITPEQSPLAGHFNYNRAALNFRPNFNPLSGSGIDSSGYSSSEGTRRNPTAAANLTCSSSRSPSNTVAEYTNRFSSAFCDSISLMATAVHTKVMHLRNLANTSFSSNMKKACGLLLLLLIILLCIWFLFPLLTPLLSGMTFTTTLSQTKPNRQPVIPTTPGPQPITMNLPTPVLDQAVVAAAVEAKMQSFMEEMNLKHTQLQQKQEHLISQRQDRLQLDLDHVQAKLEVAESSNRLRLEQEVAGLGRQMADYHTDGRSIFASLSTKIQTLENQNAELYEELSSIQMVPPPAPCPDVSTSHDHNRLTPELQQAMEKWLTDRIKEHDAFMLLDKGSSSDCGRPMADKMPDFALETQGASVISTRCSETYRIRSACVTLFGFPLWYPSESPRTVIQGFPVQLPGKCWAFHGVEGTLVISLSHPITITHVTLDHLPRYNSPTGHIDSAPKDFEVYGMKNDTEEGTLLGTFTYDEDGQSTQTFRLLNPSEMVYRFVELRVLSNWGHVEYTCLYRFRVHGQIAST